MNPKLRPILLKKRIPFILTFATTAQGNFNISTEATAQGWNGKDSIIIRGAANIIIYAASTATYAITVPASIPLAVDITFDFVTTTWLQYGRGGNATLAGGPALDLQRPVKILAPGQAWQNYIKGGGGGGGSFGGINRAGGGGGMPLGIGGAGQLGGIGAGENATLTSAGAGGYNTLSGGSGGYGGYVGENGSPSSSGVLGGTAGTAIPNFSYVTLI